MTDTVLAEMVAAGPPEGAMPNLVGVVAAARALETEHSTVSRYVKSNPELNHGTGRRVKIDLVEYTRHRAANVNPARLGSHAGRLLGEGAGGVEVAGGGEDAGGGEAASVGEEEDSPDRLSYARAKAASVFEDVARKRRERHEAEGRLLPADAVTANVNALFGLLMTMVDRIEFWNEDLARACGGDAAMLRPVLRTKLRVFRGDLTATIQRLPIGQPIPDDDDLAEAELASAEGVANEAA